MLGLRYQWRLQALCFSKFYGVAFSKLILKLLKHVLYFELMTSRARVIILPA